MGSVTSVISNARNILPHLARSVRPRSPRLGAVAAIVLLSLSLTTAGCRRGTQGGSAGTSQTSSDTARQTATLHRDELFEIAISNLNRLYQFEGTEMALQVADRLDQWIKTQPPLTDWAPDPLLQKLPPDLAQLKAVKELGELRFTRDDGIFLQTAVWLRDIAGWARGDQPDELSRAIELFDWVVINIQLDSQERMIQLPSGQLLIHTPWETLLLGHGTVFDRAWVYLLLCRQEGLDAAVVAVNRAAAGAQPLWEVFAVGVLINGELYLFEPALGVPIPAKDGLKVEKGKGLVIRPATLKELAADDSLLRRLDADPRNPYRVKAEDLREVMLYVEGSPPYLSRRMEMVQKMLAGTESLVITAHPSELAERLRQAEHVKDVELWVVPYEAEQQRETFGQQIGQLVLREIMPYLAPVGAVMPLWRGRVLYFRGDLVGEESAAYYLQLARPPERLLASGNLPPDQEMILNRAKINASYWLGILALYQGNRKSAEDYFIKRTALSEPDSPWESGVLYALGRLNEKLGDYSRAITAYRSEMHLPNRYGNLVRAKWLEELTGAKPLEIDGSSHK
ncbi:MAG: hypothetical protein H5U08_06865 [Thermogutta sp.]|uniref:tetratricopeptide repeat protein n=1 Tax=Thermogutta sp. TaxID=1962930 RepID=UPI00198E7375|nr:hypothetical protein [Thermogutta sp.]MBC7352063.1 hypothetical protein [Thermogutta sp.]